MVNTSLSRSLVASYSSPGIGNIFRNGSKYNPSVSYAIGINKLQPNNNNNSNTPINQVKHSPSLKYHNIVKHQNDFILNEYFKKLNLSNSPEVIISNNKIITSSESLNFLTIPPMTFSSSRNCISNQTSLAPTSIKEIRLPSLVKEVTITVPSLYNSVVLEMPSNNYHHVEKVDHPAGDGKEVIIQLPTTQIIEKFTVNKMINIKRRKMKKHKRLKKRRKYKHVIAKIKMLQSKRKELAFQSIVVAQLMEGETFNAEKYVAELLKQVKDPLPPPKFWEYLPPDSVRMLREKRDEHLAKKDARERKVKEEALNAKIRSREST